MSSGIRLLVVEDNPDDLQSWARAIERHNASHGIELELLTANSADAADALLKRTDINAAIIDLRLDGNGKNPDNSSGNEVVENILKHKLAVTAIFTGQPTDAAVPSYAADQVKVFTKGGGDSEGIAAVMSWLVDQFPLITCVEQAGLTIKQEMADVFNQSIWPRWRFWMDDPNSAEKNFLNLCVARHITSHVHESLTEKLGQGAHAEEWYLLPPSPAGIRTGDLIKNANNSIEIVVTPRCDFATGKNATVQLAFCEDISADWNTIKNNISALEKELAELVEQNQRERKKQVQDLLGKQKSSRAKYIAHNGGKNALHFLPKMKLARNETVGPFLVHFDQLRSVEISDADPSITDPKRRFATVSPVFLPSLVERLGGFFSRIGTPNYYHIDDDALQRNDDDAPSSGHP